MQVSIQNLVALAQHKELPGNMNAIHLEIILNYKFGVEPNLRPPTAVSLIGGK